MSSDETRATAASRAARLVTGLVVVAVAVGALVVGLVRERARSAEPPSAAAAPAPEGPSIVTVYYFHGDARCKTCLAIESQTTEVVHRVFADELAGGLLRFEIVNFDEPANRHFLDDYGLAYGTVVVQGAGEAGNWEDLADVWTYIHAEGTAFEDYLVEHIRGILDSTG